MLCAGLHAQAGAADRAVSTMTHKAITNHGPASGDAVESGADGTYYGKNAGPRGVRVQIDARTPIYGLRSGASQEEAGM